MAFVGKLNMGTISNFFSSVQSIYNELNPATLSGAVDIVVVEQPDGELACSPFHVRFGKFSLLMPQEKKVKITINDQEVPYVMKLGEAGEAFFVFETEHEVPEEFQTSPLMEAVDETKTGEEPPYLDIGESKNRPNNATAAAKVKSDTKDKDEFDEEERIHTVETDINKLRLPAELQSPKMIIEEQMDKVVTKGDPYQKHHELEKMADKLTLHHHDDSNDITPKHDTYPLDDGSTLLERVIPDEAVTSTTIARETFIVRPADGDINSTWLDVTHTSAHEHDKLSESYVDQQRNAEHESIVLDIAGYKTQDQKGEDHHGNLVHGNSTPSNNEEPPVVSSPDPIHEIADLVERTDLGEEKKEEEGESKKDEASASGWGWGTSRKKSTDDSVVGPKKLLLEHGAVYRVEMSLCGLTTFGTQEAENAKLFNEHQINYDTFVHNPNLLNDRRLVFRYEGRYYAAGRTGPLFTSLFLFHEPLANAGQDGLDNQNQAPDKQSDSRESYLFGRGWRQWWSRSSVTGPAMDNEEGKNDDETTTRFTTTTTTTSVGWSPDHSHPDEEHTDNPLLAPHKNYAKTLRLTSDQLKNLGLKKGENTITFSVTTAYQGTATCMAQIFYWDYDIQIVISDIDGTITKSDALGHVFNFIGKDWTHTGVAKLYTDITNNGYHILYLTSRAIGQADYTRDYLKRVEQGKHQLPAGPVIMSPDRLFTSFHREVIMRKPEIFKMACLRDIQRLFSGHNPFYAGFGNRITDAISYRSVDVPASRIFTIDPNGDVKLELLLGFLSSYIHLNDLVDQIFPPINKAIGEEFSDWNYWKQPLPEIDIPELENIAPTPTSPKPIPIKPDPTSSLPSTVVVESEAQKQRQQRGILRSFTSRSSSTTTNASETTLGARHYSTSTPSLVTPRSGRTSPTESARSASPTHEVTTDQKPGVSVMPHHSADDLLATSPSASPAPSSASSSSSLINKMSGFGGVLSRTFSPRKSSLSEELLHHPSTLSRVTSKEEQTFDMDDEEEELDLDSIPFI
ncbi:Lipin/Ned1/Smp2-domain-containing protein [Fennellomyces sp. T-0311]|nr:Lipin/Ned1/Smp2-domain-containing protein [Fennellomyces sp. T-0311]